MDNNSSPESTPIVSIITPCYNDGHYLVDAIASAKRCDGSLSELLIVDDGSTEPDTLALLSQLKEEGYNVIHQENRGLAASRNRGIAEARGKYILPLDSDNKVRPEYLLRGIEILDRLLDVEVVYGDLEYFGQKIGRSHVADFELQSLLKNNFVDACAMFRKSTWATLGGYDETMVTGFEDWDFWIRIASLGGRFYHVPEVLFDYRVRNGSMSHVLHDPEKFAKAVAYIRSKNIPAKVDVLRQLSDPWSWATKQFRDNPLRLLGSLVKKSFFTS